MTAAVCFRCGKIKFGAFVPCPKCGAEPRSEDDLVLSLAMTDHYFGPEDLEAMGRRVAEGDPPRLAPETHADLVATLRESGIMDTMERERRRAEARHAAAGPEAGLAKRPWWKFW